MSSDLGGHECKIFSEIDGSFQDMKINVADISREGLRFENSKIESRKDSWGTPQKRIPHLNKILYAGECKKRLA